MTPHAKVYFNHFDYVVQEEVMCECCTRPAVDIHHINGRIGPEANTIKNLIALCRKCHDLAHAEKISKGELAFIHNNVLVGNRKVFIH
jgi:hypothetical protein